MTFRWKTALLVVTMTIVTMGLAFGGVWYYFVASQRRQLDDALVAVANREAAEAALGQLSFSDAPGPSANANGPLPKYGVIYSRDGVPLTKTDNFQAAPTMPRGVSLDRCFDFDHERVELRAVLVAVPQSSMRVLLASPRDDIVHDGRILAWAMTVAFAVGCGWAGLVAFLAATRLTRNYRTVEAVARRVAAGDASARVTFSSKDGDLNQLADDLNSMIERLVGLALAQDRFVAHAAHELRTPLTALRIELEHALATAREPTEYEAAVRGALDSGRKLSTLADELLVVARARAGALPAGEIANVSVCVANAAAAVERLALARGVTIDVVPAPSTLVRGDSSSLTRILRNLLENAVRFTPPGTTIRVLTSMHEPLVEVRVVDEGSGVPAADRTRIFEPFERLVRDDGHQGAGLGLSIARSLARSMGGDVALDSVDGGASFVVRLQVHARTDATPRAGIAEPEDASGEVAHGAVARV